MTIEIKIKKVPVYGIKSYKEDKFYVTSDGKEFKEIKEAEAWQVALDIQEKKDIVWDSIKKIDCDDIDFINGDKWYFVENDEQLEILKHVAGFYDTYDYHFVYGEWKVGEWVTWQYDDGGDHRGTNNCYTFSYVRNEINKFLNKFKEI